MDASEDSREYSRNENEQQLISKLKQRRVNVKLDGTINVNTLISVATILVSGALAYATLDKRIAILEQLQAERSVRVEKQLEELKGQIRELTQILTSKRDRQ